MKSTLSSPRQRWQIFVRSIRFRLTLLNVLILAVILVIFSVFVYTRQAQVLQLQAQSSLDAKFQQLEGIYRLSGLFGGDSDHFQPPDLTVRGAAIVGDATVLALVGPDGSVLQKAGAIDDSTASKLVLDWQQANLAGPPVYQTQPYQLTTSQNAPVQYLFLVAPLVYEHRPVGLVLLGRPLDPDGQLAGLLVTLLLGSAATLALALAGGYWLAGRAMAPVRTITRTARSIGETDLHRRLHLGSQDELGELANTFDAMLDRLQAAFDRQRQFTADASHELRTPLTIIGLEADQALDRRRTPEEYGRALKVIQSENEFMGQLVNDLLTLARMDAGQTVIRTEPVDLGEIAVDVVERLSSLARRSGVELAAGELPETPVQGDRRLLSQMLTNLVQNAILYAGGPGHQVQLETGIRQAAGHPQAWVQVADDGPGIAPDHLPHLFDRFYRVDRARSRSEDSAGRPEQSPDGSGLGLSIVQWIARAHGGEVIVQSQVGQGATFEVRLPLAQPSPISK